mmetsp:Transcript_9984/g.15072  ORF Transcript_9984/g.15072 Transcript_9984/m.15072 type:complete len:457 (-) Transcript_9984:25-1395(-)
MSALPDSCEVVIVGGGVAGASTAVHLLTSGVRDIILLEAGSPGDGRTSYVVCSDQAHIKPGDCEDENVFAFAHRSGSAVLDATPGTVKMMVNLYASSTAEFCKHHGEEGARRYLSLAAEGIRIEKRLAAAVLSDPTHIRSLGSLYLAEESDADSLRAEFDALTRLGCAGVEWWSEEKVQAEAGPGFSAGIFFPDDGIINSAQYCKDLLRYGISCNETLENALGLRVYENTQVLSVNDVKGAAYAVVKTTSGHEISCKYVVVATGGLSVDPSIAGVIRPCWSYLVGIKDSVNEVAKQNHPHPFGEMKHPNSPNFFTWGFTHDWCMTDGVMRISGEDHYSALKPPRMKERCAAMAKWTYNKYPYLQPTGSATMEYSEQYGVYSETPDCVPLIGTPRDDSRLCYIVGCNAWGQAVLSYSASLIPGILGYTTLSESQKDALRLLTIRRFALLPVVRGVAK